MKFVEEALENRGLEREVKVSLGFVLLVMRFEQLVVRSPVWCVSARRVHAVKRRFSLRKLLRPGFFSF